MKTLLLFGALTFGLNSFGQTNNYSLEYDGVDDYVNCISNLPDSSNSLTVCAWVNVASYSNGYGKIFDLKSGASRITLQSIAANTGLGFQVQSLPIGQVGVVLPNFNVSNNWFYLTGKWTDSTISLYVNGSLVVESPQTLINEVYFSDTANIFHFGAKIDTINHFHGLIDDISFWSYSLDSLEIQQYMNCPPTGSEQGLVGYWNFEEGTGISTNDLTSNGNDRTLLNGVTWSTNVPSYTCDLGIDEVLHSEKELVMIIDFMGRETEFKPNTPLIFIYSDGSRERVMKLEE